MGSSVLSRIQIIMEANTAKYNNEMKRARENSDKTFSEIGKSAGKSALIVGAALAGMGALSIKTAMSFETSMAEIDKTVDFASSNGLANMRKELQELTTRIPQTFQELAAVTATGGQLGIAEGNLVHFTEVMAKMGVAFDIPAQQAADSMAKIANVFQIPIENIDGLGDAINTLSNNTPAVAQQLIESLLRVGGVAKVFGLSEDATLGLTGALIAMGKPAEVASTAVNSLLTTFSTLDNATKSQYIGFEQLGLDIDKFSQLVKTDGKQAITTYLEAINKLDQSERIGTNALIVGKEFGDDITMLAASVGVLENNWAMLGETANTTKVYAGSMNEEFKKISATSANKLVLFKNNIYGVVASVGEAFIPALNDLLLNMTPIVTIIGVWAAANPELIQQIALIGGALVGSIVSLKLAVDGFTAAKTTVDGLKIAYAALGSTMGLTVLGLGILVAAGFLVYQNWDKIKQVVNDNKPAFIALGVVVTALTVALIAANAPLILLKVQAAAAAVQAGVMAVATAVWSVAAGVAAAATWAFNGALAVLTSPILAVVAAIALIAVGGYLVVKNWGAISAGLRAEFEKIKAGVMSAVNSMQAAWNNAVARTRTAFINIGNTISTTLKALPSKMLTIGKQIVDGLVNGIKNGASNVANAIGNVASSAVAKAKSVLDIHSPSRVMKTVGEQTAQGMADGIRKGKKAVVTEAQKMAADAVMAVKDGIINLQKELALFGDSSKLSDFNYDVKIGKYNGASQNDINETRELLKRLALRNDENDVVKEMILIQRSIYDASVLQSTELGRMNYELDDIHGKYKGIGEAMKDSLRVEAAKLDAVKLSASAAKTMLDIDRQMSLLDNDSMFNQWAFDLTDAAGSMVNLDEAMKDALLTKIADYEQAKKASEINNSIADSLEAIKRETALLNDSSPLANFLYDLNETDKFAHAAGESIVDLGDALTALQATKDRISSRDALKGMLSGLEQQSPMGKIIADYESRNEIIATFEQLHTDLVATANEARLASDSAYMNAKQQLMIGQSGAIFSALTGMAKGFLGEQSGIYRALYTVQKSYTLASALLSSKKAIMDAWSDTAGGYFAKSLAVGKVILSTSEITSAIAGLAPDGFKSGGYTGNMGVDQIAGPVHGQEFVFDAPATKRIGVNNLERMRSGNVAGGGDINVNVTVSMEGKSSVESDSAMGKQIGQGLAAVVVGEVRKMMRPNGEMDRVYAKR